ncbi:MAG: copper ion binding protein [Candidatus Bathyarchaeia archaeon]
MAEKKIKVKIGGMHCASCAQTIERTLRRVDGVAYSTVNFATEEASIEYDPDRVSIDRIEDAIKEVGYEPIEVSSYGERTRKISLKIGGMHCASCVQTVEKALKGVEGVKSVHVNLATEKATVEYSPHLTSISELKRVVQKVGYRVESEEEFDRYLEEMKRAHRRMIYAWAFTIPIIVWMGPRDDPRRSLAQCTVL